MTNDFYTKLANLSDAGNTAEHISPGVGTRSLNGVLSDVHLLLFPNPANRAETLQLAFCYLRLVQASGYGHYITAQDRRLSYRLDDDFNDYFKTASFDLQAVDLRVKKRKSQVDRLFHDLPTDDQTPQNLWNRHANPVMRIAGVVIGLVQRIQ